MGSLAFFGDPGRILCSSQHAVPVSPEVSNRRHARLIIGSHGNISDHRAASPVNVDQGGADGGHSDPERHEPCGKERAFSY